jgi:hypothetical protein
MSSKYRCATLATEQLHSAEDPLALMLTLLHAVQNSGWHTTFALPQLNADVLSLL